MTDEPAGLSGDLRTVHLAEILQWCRTGRKTGAITLRRRGIKKEVYVEDGHIVSAASDDPREYFGQYLVTLGKITEEQLELAFGIQRETGVLLGKILVARGFISEVEMGEILRLKITETIFNLFLWQDGLFAFRQQQLSPQHRRVDVRMEVDHCILEGAKRVDDWKRYRALFPHDDTVPEPGEHPAPPPEAGLARKLLELVRERVSIAEMCRRSHALPFTVLTTLYELHRQGLVAPPRPGSQST